MTSLWWDFSSYLPNRRFPVLILVEKQLPNLKFSPNVLHFETLRVILFVFSFHTRGSSCQLGKCTRKLLLIPLIAMKSGNALDLPLTGISLNTSIVLDCPEAVSISPVLFILVRKSDYHIYLFYWSIPKILWSSGYGVGPQFPRRVVRWFKSWPGLYICKYFLLNWKYFMSNRSFFASGKIYKLLVLRFLLDYFHFIDIPISVG